MSLPYISATQYEKIHEERIFIEVDIESNYFEIFKKHIIVYINNGCVYIRENIIYHTAITKIIF